MFSRSCRSAFVCLRCQHRLTRGTQNQPCPSLGIRPQALVSSRQQSTATARIVEEEDNTDEDATNPPKTPSRDRKRKRVKSSWRPDPVAQLGVSSLGKPAEVLLLKDRDRIIPKLPTEPEKEHEHAVLESLNSENQPLNPEQIKTNIEQIRAQVGQQRGQLEDEKWRQVRKSLWKGFAQKQLQAYIESSQGEAAKPFQRGFNGKKWGMKQRMAHYIAKHIWGFTGSDTTETKKEVKPETSTEFKMPGPVLDVLLLQENTSLKDISEQHQVQIDVFREPAKIILSGSADSIKAARELLETLSSKVKRTKFAFHRPVPATIVQDLRTRHRVHILLLEKKNAVYVYHHTDVPADLDSIRRKLLLAQLRESTIHRSVMWPESLATSVIGIPIGLSAYASQDTRGRLNRFVVGGPAEAVPSMGDMTREQKDDFKSTYMSIWTAMRSLDHLSQLVAAQSTLREERTAIFGQALYEGTARASAILDAKSTADPFFISEIPLLPQFLAKRKVWKESQPWKREDPKVVESNPASTFVSPQPRLPSFNYRLTLRPAQESSTLPPLEILLTGPDFKKALKQPLQIQRITATIDQKRSYLLLPSHPVDIQFRKSVKQDLYLAGAATPPTNAPLLAQLAEYFNKAAGMAEPTFAPFATLNIPLVLLKRVVLARTPQEEVKKLKTPKGSGNPAEYVLETATALDVAGFMPPFMSNLRIEHVVFMEEGEMGRQVVRLTDQSMLRQETSVTEKKSTFAGFFNSAYEIALMLGDPGLMR